MTTDLTLRTTTDRARTLSGMIDEQSVVERQGALKLNRVPASGQRSLEFILAETLAAPADPRDAWTTARAYIYRRDSEGIAVYSGQQRVVNTHMETSGEEGQYGTADRINGLWIVRSLQCAPLPAEDPEEEEPRSGRWRRPAELLANDQLGPGDET